MAHGGCWRRSRAQQRQPRMQRAGGGAEDDEGVCVNAQGGDERLLLAGVVCMLKQRKKQRSWRCAQRAAEELVGAVPATKTHGGGRGWNLRS